MGNWAADTSIVEKAFPADVNNAEAKPDLVQQRQSGHVQVEHIEQGILREHSCKNGGEDLLAEYENSKPESCQVYRFSVSF